MNNILKQIQTLYEQELYSNVVRVCDITLSISEQKPETITLPVKHQVLWYYADSLYNTQQYLQAENLYRQALQMKQNIKVKTKNSNNKMQDVQVEMTTDVDIRYKIHLCCLALKQVKGATEILHEISVRNRTPKINMALGNIYRDSGMDRPAITYFKDVLNECPMALEAADNLLKLGIKGVEVNSLMVEASNDISWLNTWLKAQAQLHSRDFANAIVTYKSMDQHGFMKDNPTLLVNMGYCYHSMCENKKAISILQRAYHLDPRLILGQDLFSTLLANSSNKEDIKILESLTPTQDMSLWTCEQWIVLGNYMYANKKYEKAAYFAQQAYTMNRKNVEALLLKANIYFQLKKYNEAATHCTEALNACSYRFDIYKCLVDSLLQLNRLKEAESIAQNALKVLNNSPQALCLLVTVLLKDQMASQKCIRKYLEKAVMQDKNLTTNALSMLVEFLEQENQHEEASQILLKHIETNPTSRLHQLLGDCFVNLQKDNEAFHHFTTALKLDPNNQRATEGLNNIGRVSLRDSYYSCGDASYNSTQATTSSDHEADPESDTDPWNGMENFD
ncbi:unnamed protein product [Brassicogethes aeneus]|uniref:Anaphase-promoting complex subunit 7 n=1 Tax=Brassicogethes aeneus TaxID=1431903 RepID=A0A9P0FH38_BRAAE|nr:unnamed protein product [Brassicogethes aeneus]